MKATIEEARRRVREVLDTVPKRTWATAKLPPARIALVQFSLVEIEEFPSDLRAARN
jgi:hypothetical protein